MVTPDEVRRLLLAEFPGADIEIVDLTGTQDHYQARIVSAAFEQKTPIEQHRMVYAALGSMIHGPIHALALKTYTPTAWAKLNGES